MCARWSPNVFRSRKWGRPSLWRSSAPDLKSSFSPSPCIIRVPLPSRGTRKITMAPVEIIIFSNPEQDARRPLEKLLQGYDSPAGVQINDIGWNVAWSETLKISLYKAGGDVSQVGA